MSHAFTPSIDRSVRSYNPSTVGRVVHGVGAFREVANLIVELDARRVVVAGNRTLLERTDLAARLRDQLGDRLHSVAPPIAAHSPQSDVDLLEAEIKAADADAVIALGGSSVSDAAKIAALRAGGATPQTLVTDGDVQTGRTGLTEKPIPWIAVPTTLSVGEFNHGAGMVSTGHGGKIMVLDDRLPAWAVVFDPEVTLTTPRQLWLSSGVKAIDHAAESMWGNRSHPVGDALAVAALPRLISSLSTTARHFEDLDARLESQIAAWMSVATMKNTSIYLSHIIAHCIGSRWHVPHGITSCITLPVVMNYLAGDSPERVSAAARVMGLPTDLPVGDVDAARAGAAWITGWIEELELPRRLRDFAADPDEFPTVARDVMNELSYFDAVPAGGSEAIEQLLQEMW